MTGEEDLRRLLHDAATEIPASSAPVGDLVGEGRRTKRQRHIVQAASVATAAALIAVGAFIVQPSISGSGNLATRPTATPSGLGTPQMTTTPRTPESQCEPKPPHRLMDGSPAGQARLVDPDKTIYVWGRGDKRISQLVGGDPLGLIGAKYATHVQAPHATAYIIDIGDPGVGEVAFAFSIGRCRYTVWLPGGTAMKQAKRFVSALLTPPTTPRRDNQNDLDSNTRETTETTPCSKVITPPSAQVHDDISVSRAEGIMVISFSYSDPATKKYDQRSYAIAYNDDPTCRANPFINQFIERSLTSLRPHQNEPSEVDYPRVAGLFYSFAEDTTRGGPFDTPVSLGLGNNFVRSVPPDSGEAAWVLDLTHYAERDGTVSALELLRDNADNLKIVTEPQSRPSCAAEADEPPLRLTGGGTRISIQSQQPVDCTQSWSVDLFINDVGQVVGVNVTLGSP